MIDGFETVGIASAHGGLAAQFVPDANMLCHSLTVQGVPLLPPGRGVAAYAEHGKTMGIPLLYPWANRLSGDTYEAAGKRVTLPPAAGRYELDPNGLPRHGALPKLMRWQVYDTAGDRCRARLSWDAPELLELFPFRHEVDLEAALDAARLRIEVTVRASAGDPVPISFGAHPYLRPAPDVARRDWQVRLGASQRVVLDDLLIPTGATEPLPERVFTLDDMSWDDGLEGLDDPPVFSVAGGGRRLTVTFEHGFRHAQIYAPPEQDLISFEPMTAPTNALVDGRGLTVVAPGDEYRAAFAVAVADN